MTNPPAARAAPPQGGPASAPAMPRANADGFFIRSYVLRQGRFSRAQRRAFQDNAARYLLPVAATNWPAVFGRAAPLVADIGSGHGEATAAMAAADAQRDYVAYEVHAPGVGALLAKLAAGNIDNARITHADALRALPIMFADGALAQANIFFPDPWPKTRHQKRRLLRPEVVELLWRKLATGGGAHFVTDCPDYGKQAAARFAAHGGFAAAAPPARARTGFEARAQAAGHPVQEWYFVKR